MPPNQVIPLPARPGAAHSLDDIERLAAAVAKSGMFGIRTTEQALVLMAISQAEGRHPALAARDYDIIQGRPAKKAEAMLRDMLDSGGKVEWHQLTDSVADATFSHPAGGSVRIVWDTQRVKLAGLEKREGHMKYPRAMLRSRCVSEGVRTVCPMATSGMYVAEEVRDMPAPLSDDTTSDTTADLDQFAADTGEVTSDTIPPSERDILAEARAAASDGSDTFRAFWRDLSPPERDSIRAHLEEFSTTAKTADDPFGLPPIPTAAVAATEVTESPHPPLQRSAIWQEPTYRIAPAKLIDGATDWDTWAFDITHLIGEATEVELDKLWADNKEQLNALRRNIGHSDRYRELVTATSDRRVDLKADAMG